MAMQVVSSRAELLKLMRAGRGGRRLNKHNATRIQFAGRWWHSKMEAARYVQLLLLVEREALRDLVLQPRFKFHCGRSYIADFSYTTVGQNSVTSNVVEDVKGFETKEFKIKRDLLRDEYGIAVQMVTLNSRCVNDLLAVGEAVLARVEKR